MKKIVLLIAIVLISQYNFAQDASFKQDVLKLISISGADGAMKVAKPQLMNMIGDNDKENFSKEFDASLPSLYDKITKTYMEIYTHEDVKAMIAFYESPVGKKMSEKAGELLQKSMKSGQEWTKELFVIVEKYKKATASEDKMTTYDEVIYSTAGLEVKPDFPDGISEFYKFIATNYTTPKVKNLKGKVFVTFIIEKDGSLTDIKVIRDLGHGTAAEAIRVLKLSPKWMPGEQNGKKVRCTYSLPISIESGI